MMNRERKTSEEMKETNKVNESEYFYYSKLLNEPFKTVPELKEAEEAYYAKQKAKVNAAATKKADATKVEDTFKALNAARKTYKEESLKITQLYADALKGLELEVNEKREVAKKTLSDAELNYKNALKEFTDKYKEGYHLTLRDPEHECETTISSERDTLKKPLSSFDSLFDLIFNF